MSAIQVVVTSLLSIMRAMHFAGFWQQILQFMAMLAVVTNFAIISYTKLDTGPE